jgi:hypothetical protein
MKYLFITLEVQDGERRHDHRVLHTTNCTNVHFAVEYYAAHFWGESERQDNDEWWWVGGEFAIRVYSYTELSKEEYDFMSGIFSRIGN